MTIPNLFSTAHLVENISTLTPLLYSFVNDALCFEFKHNKIINSNQINHMSVQKTATILFIMKIIKTSIPTVLTLCQSENIR